MIENQNEVQGHDSKALTILRGIDCSVMSEWFFYCAFAIYSLVFAMSHTTFQDFFGLDVATIVALRQPVILAFLAGSILLSKKRVWQWVTIVVVIAIALVSWRMSGENWLFWLTLFIVSAKGVRIKPLAWIMLAVTAGALLSATICSLTGIIDNIVVIRQGAERYSLGFAHPNTFGTYLLVFALSFSVVRFGKNPFPDLLVLLIVIAVNATVTDSRAAIIVAIAQGVLLLVFYWVKSVKARAVCSGIMLGITILMVLVSIFFMLFYDGDNSIHALADRLLSTRLSLAHSYFEMAPISMFGNSFEGYEPIVWDSGNPLRFVVDNAYCHLILAYGLVPALVFFEVFFTYYVELVCRHCWNVMLFGLAVMAVYAFVETMGIRVEGNYFLIGIGAELFYGGNMLSEGKHAGTARVGAPEHVSPRRRA